MKKFHNVLKAKYVSFKQLESEIEALPTTSEKGKVFEQFVYSYLNIKKNFFQINKIYSEKEIPNNFRKSLALEGSDCGVDGLIEFNNGKIAAYQVKFRSNRVTPSYSELSKFWVEAKNADFNYTIANCYYLTRLAEKNEKHHSILVDDFDSLDHHFFETLYDFINNHKLTKRYLYTPEKFQEIMINGVVEGFSKHDRGKLIAACGTGKTLTSLWISEKLNTKNVLFLAPSLALIKQTLESWSEQTRENFTYICICSDNTVADEINDIGDISVSDFIVPVTTDINQVVNFLSSDVKGKKVVFSTYQSLEILFNSNKKLPGFSFDLTIFDEAHRTAGVKNSSLFSLALDNDAINSSKRLFMTATERLIRPWILKKAAEYNRVVFSMDDESLYGPLFHRFNFGEAIKLNVISDYRVVIAGVSESQIFQWIKDNELLVDIENNQEEFVDTARNIFYQVLLIKSMLELPIRKVITFHNSIYNAKMFANGKEKENLNLNFIRSKIIPDMEDKNFFVDHVNGSMSSGERKQKLDNFKDSEYGVITNSRCLTEGVDVPIIDSIYFVDPRNSLIDIVQACGRALRKTREDENKIAYFLVPILIPEGISNSKSINEEDFEMLFNLIQSLRDQDLRLAQWIDEINLNVTKGNSKNQTSTNNDPFLFNFPKEFDIDAFKEQLYIRIAEVNGNPTSYDNQTKSYGKKERKSEHKRIFKTLGDYSYSSYKENLVDPTIAKFEIKNELLSRKDLIINHNNTSHTEKLGLINNSHKKFNLTSLGKQYFDNEISFTDLFKRQMLRHFVFIDNNGQNRVLFPYRAALEILLKVNSINYIEFVFGLYTIFDSSENSILKSSLIIKKLRREFPNIQIINKSNQETVLLELNTIFNTNYSSVDLWEKKTTIYNQYIYFRDHLSLFDDLILITKNPKILILKDNCHNKLEDLLNQDKDLEFSLKKSKLQSKYIENLIITLLFTM